MSRRSSFAVFLKQWRAAFRDHDPDQRRDPGKHNYWEEGELAYRRLKDASLLSAILFLKKEGSDEYRRHGWRAGEAMRLLIRELKSYKTNVGGLVEVNRKYKDFVDFLERMAKSFSKQQKTTHAPFDGVLAKYVRMIQGDIAAAEKEHLRAWLPTAGVWGHVLHEPNRRKLPMRVLELEGSFQTKIGAIFRAFLDQASGVDLRTVSRLVVLFYLCAGLADDQEGHLIVRSTGTRLTVGAVDQKLRRAGLR